MSTIGYVVQSWISLLVGGVLRCVVRGGTYGGRLTITLNGAGESKISRVAGNALPKNVEISPGIERTFEIEYTPVAPSDGENDIVATATFVENFLNVTSTETASLTSIKVELMSIDVAPENNSCNRHVYGIGELFYLMFSQCPTSMSIDVTGGTCYGRGLSNLVRWSVENGTHEICVTYGLSSYCPSVVVLIPTGIESFDVAARSLGLPIGQAGGVELEQKYRVLPKTVSFSGISMEEVPCYDVIPPIGYFSLLSTNSIPLTHNEQAQAGHWQRILEGNVVAGVDHAGIAGALPRMKTTGELTTDETFGWLDGSLTWMIPFGWGSRLAVDGDAPIGVFSDDARQVFSLSHDGEFSITKLGHTASRKINGEVRKDGELVD